MTVPFAVLASGSGTNVQALLDHEDEGAAYRIELLVTDRPCGAEERARARGRAVYRVDFNKGAGIVSGGEDGGREATGDRVLRLLRRHRAEGVLLAGFLKLLPAGVCRAYVDRILNVHPALLPSFGGKGMYGRRVHEAVLRTGATLSGPTVHFVNERYDEGRILAQWPVPVHPGDSAGTLAARVLKAEHALYPAAADALARALADGRPGAGAAPSFRWSRAGETAVFSHLEGGMDRQEEHSEVRAGGRRALLSVSDKTGIVVLGRTLAEHGWEVLSTGGTARVLADAGVPTTEVAVLTGHPEMMDGRVKTLHPAVHAGLLARRGHPADMAELARQGYAPIDLVAANLYPFRETVAARGVTPAVAMENIDIGGPALIRAAAKNHRDVWVVVDPADYAAVLDTVAGSARGQSEPGTLRRRLAAKVFREVSSYDTAIARYLEESESGRIHAETGGGMAERITLELERRELLRYGENPGQKAAFYAGPHGEEGIADLEQLHGKTLSYNNILDLDGALLTLAPFAFSHDPAVCIVKHTTPCGLAVRETLAAAFERARATDPVSAFGSVIAVNRPVDRETAAGIGSMFVECVAAPGFTDGALDVLGAKKNVRLLRFPGSGSVHPAEPVDDRGWTALDGSVRAAARFLARAAGRAGGRAFRSVYGGVLLQSLPDPPFCTLQGAHWRVVSARAPTEAERCDLSFAWAAVAAVKSNAILLAKTRATVGIGTGQTSRVDSSRLAVLKAREVGLGSELAGCALASDAFFPFRDGVDVAAEAGVRAIIQPGGSVRDEEVVQAADRHGIAMVFTGRRLFRH